MLVNCGVGEDPGVLQAFGRAALLKSLSGCVAAAGDAGRAGCRVRGGGPWADCRGPIVEGIRDGRVPRAVRGPEGG